MAYETDTNLHYMSDYKIQTTLCLSLYIPKENTLNSKQRGIARLQGEKSQHGTEDGVLSLQLERRSSTSELRG